MPRELQVNWDDVSKGEVVPEGRYPARIDKIEEKKSPNGNEYLLFSFTLTEEPAVGRKVWANFMLQPTALWKLRALMKAMGLQTAGESTINFDDFLQGEVGVVIVHEMYQDEPKARVQSFYPLVV